MEKEHRIPEEATRPQPKRTSFRRAAMIAAGLAFGGEGVAAEPTGSPETRATTEASHAAPEKAAEKKEALRLRARLESFTWVTGLASDPTYAKPDGMYYNKLTPEFIDWLIARDLGDDILKWNPVSETHDFESVLMGTEKFFRAETRREARITKKMDTKSAESFIQTLKDNKELLEP